MNIYVGNLPYQLSEEELSGLFEAHGTVTSAKIITDRYNGRSKGFGFVEMQNKSEAEAAISKLHDSDFKGRKLRVNEARERTEQDRGNRSFNNGPRY